MRNIYTHSHTNEDCIKFILSKTNRILIVLLLFLFNFFFLPSHTHTYGDAPPIFHGTQTDMQHTHTPRAKRLRKKKKKRERVLRLPGIKTSCWAIFIIMDTRSLKSRSISLSSCIKYIHIIYIYTCVNKVYKIYMHQNNAYYFFLHNFNFFFILIFVTLVHTL